MSDKPDFEVGDVVYLTGYGVDVFRTEFAKKNGCPQFYCGDKLSNEKREQFYKKYGKQETDGYNKGGVS